jgi:hypothetical protein
LKCIIFKREAVSLAVEYSCRPTSFVSIQVHYESSASVWRWRVNF